MNLTTMRPRPGSVIVGKHIWWTGEDQVSYVAIGGPQNYLVKRTSGYYNPDAPAMNVSADWLNGFLGKA